MNPEKSPQGGKHMSVRSARSIDAGVADVLASVPVDIDDIRCALGLTLEEVAGVVGKSPRTVSRWRADAPDRSTARGEGARQARQLAELRIVAEDVLGRNQVATWLRSPNRGFRGKAPIDLMLQGHTSEVVAALERLADSGPA